MEEDLDWISENENARKDKQEILKQKPIVQEALAMFSEAKPNLNSKKMLNERIEVLEKWGDFYICFYY